MWITLRVKEAPERGSLFCAGGASCLRRPILFCLARKEWGEKRRWTRNSAVAPEKSIRYILRFVVTPSVVRTPFGRAAEFLPSKILLRQIFVPAKSKGVCSESMQGFQVLPVSHPQSLLVAEEKRTKQKRPKVRESGASALFAS